MKIVYMGDNNNTIVVEILQEYPNSHFIKDTKINLVKDKDGTYSYPIFYNDGIGHMYLSEFEEYPHLFKIIKPII